MKEKIVKQLWALAKYTESLFKKEVYTCCKSFTIKPSNLLQHEIVGTFIRILNALPQKNLVALKEFLELSCQERIL